jgi:hypothetical protein
MVLSDMVRGCVCVCPPTHTIILIHYYTNTLYYTLLEYTNTLLYNNTLCYTIIHYRTL